MIPSEFNQDLIAQRRKLRMLHERRKFPAVHKPTPGSGPRSTWIEVAKPINEFQFFVFRRQSSGGMVDELAGPFTNFSKAAAEGKKIADKTGERLKLQKNQPLPQRVLPS